MAAINEHTRKMITTAIKETTDVYREGWERVFGRKKPDENCVTTPDGGCVGKGCMHDPEDVQ